MADLLFSLHLVGRPLITMTGEAIYAIIAAVVLLDIWLATKSRPALLFCLLQIYGLWCAWDWLMDIWTTQQHQAGLLLTALVGAWAICATAFHLWFFLVYKRRKAPTP